MPQTTARVSVQPLTSCLGAVVGGVDLRRVGAQLAATLREALWAHQVLFFRDQELTMDEQLAVARSFGEIDPEALSRVDSGVPPGVSRVRTEHGGVRGGLAVDVWHSDSMFREQPPGGAVLHALTVPERGGDTLWASMYAAYDALTPPMRRLLDGLHAEHSVEVTLRRMAGRARLSGGARVEIKGPEAARQAVHPVVRVHPVTRRKLLFVSASWTTRIVELSEAESDAVLRFLFEHVKTPEFQCRFSWRPGSVAIWDNRAVLHYASGDYHGLRDLVRVSIAGEAVLGPEALAEPVP